MNCKPGDLAVVVRGAKYCGHLLEVLKAAPHGDFNLPDGYPAYGAGQGWWLVKFFRKVAAPTGPKNGPPTRERMTYFAVVADYGLRPIRDSDGEDETLTWAGKPADVVAHGPMVRGGQSITLPHAVGGEPLQTWLEQSTAWEGIQCLKKS